MEFTNPIIRRLVVTNGTQSITIDTSGPSGVPIITLEGASGGKIELLVDILDQPYMVYTAPDGDAYEIRADNDDWHFWGRPINTSGNSSIHFARGDGIALRSTATGAPSLLFDDDDGFIKWGSYSPWTEETWHNLPTLQNSWVASSGITPGYRMCPDGNVIFRGAIQGGTSTPATLMFTMPTGYRPPSGADEYFTVAKPNDNTNHGTIDVLANGQVRCIYSPGVSSLSLAQIRYSVLA